MNDTRIDELHRQLAQLYRGRSTDQLTIDGLWARIERLEAASVRLQTKETA